MAKTDPLARLRATVARALTPTATTRLVTLDAADLVDPAAVALHLALARAGAATPPGTARADPLRLPLIEGVADAVVARDDLGVGIKPRLREYWRVLAPAGVVILVVDLPARWWPLSDFSRAYRRGTAFGALAGSMFVVDGIEGLPGAIVARGRKADGLAPASRQTAPVRRGAPA